MCGCDICHPRFAVRAEFAIIGLLSIEQFYICNQRLLSLCEYVLDGFVHLTVLLLFIIFLFAVFSCIN